MQRNLIALFTPLITVLVPVVALSTLLASLAVYALGTPDGETPANEGVCDELMGGTLGLYGLCVGFCEAQDCEATFNETTGDVTFDASCKPSSTRLLANYNKRVKPGDPPMPCVNIVVDECPCWTEAELDDIGGGGPPPGTRCRTTGPGNGSATILNGPDVGLAQHDPPFIRNEAVLVSNGNTCLYRSWNPLIQRTLEITVDEFILCRESIRVECDDRGMPLP